MNNGFEIQACVCTLSADSTVRGSKVGVAYGRNANNLPPPDQVAQLVQKHNIQYLWIYDSDPKVLKAFSNTSIELWWEFSQSYVDSWLRNSILPYYPATNITHITVGVEVTDSRDNAANLVVPAMRNLVSALKSANLQGTIKVSTHSPLGFYPNPSHLPKGHLAVAMNMS
ncbi:hypothetical protein J1N35_032632 [Gossypium stocksii]|uniref:glucan endo-1,3-beta-D-glucosidase n=1 Tax=Gossypium stocksii TaxID=47602 RepID=A0A9D3ZWF6_9ROSI|nr:hypothetical protein J1N35_032632 [Gossypium stocksii]